MLQSPVNCLDGKHVGVKTKLVMWHNSSTHDHDALTYKSELFITELLNKRSYDVAEASEAVNGSRLEA